MNFWEKLVAVVVVVGLVGGLICLIAAARSDGKIDHCWIEFAQYQTPHYEIKGHRDWRSDVTIASEATVEEAEAKRKLLCP
jgi:hypothetical protein